jgi:acyl dehydratase
MPFDASLVGRTLGPTLWEATPRRLLAFRAVLDPDRRPHLDDAAPDGLFASPFNCVSAEWALSLALRAEASASLADAEARRGVHTGQDTRFLAPVAAGDRLLVSATLEGARATRAGVATSLLYRAVREADGVPVWETRSSSLYRDVALAGEAAAGWDRPAWEETFEPERRVDVRLDAGLPHLYSECAEIWNPIHTERRVALAAGLPDIIVHGTALWALAGQSLVWTCADSDERRLTRLACAFRSPALPASTAMLEWAGAAEGVKWRLATTEGAVLVAGLAEFSGGSAPDFPAP